jgi:hypothetical protein
MSRHLSYESKQFTAFVKGMNCNFQYHINVVAEEGFFKSLHEKDSKHEDT